MVARADDAAVLAPAETLDGFGQLGRPPQAATGLVASAFASTPVSPHHPPGLYGPENGRQAGMWIPLGTKMNAIRVG